ncbi:MAG: redox-sensing transcriptional repressor Rex [Actinobacteria bacterium]|nr:redox-sensing transcriptional repressor Rex [Actinomycetota bacterium]
MKTPVPRATVQRLPLYLQILDERGDQARTSSDELAALAGITAAKVRKDLSYLGSYGTRGVGYDVEQLRFEIRRALGLTRDWRLAIVGVGNLGSALANYDGFQAGGFCIAAVFDADPAKVGTEVAGVTVSPVGRLVRDVRRLGIDIGVVAVPAEAAQGVTDTLAAAGVRSILNFAPTVVRAPDGVEIRRVDLSTELQVLGYHLHLVTGGPPEAAIA